MTWFDHKDKPYLIAGPCSAESEDQVHETIQVLKEFGDADAIRAGIWKPRTSPNSFEGHGAKALKWLVDAGQKNDLKVCTEVASPKHVELALKSGVDFLWIGARTTVNPFLVQSIADALSGVDIPVMVKNPVNPDLNLWIGSLDRIRNAGIKQVAAIHRGFSFYGEGLYRNVPLWEIPIEFQRLMPDVPIICDPSHITGNRHLIQDVSQQALDLNFDGLMIESHLDPDKALSDASQQVTPLALHELLKNIKVRKVETDDPEFTNMLNSFRVAIDQVDDELLSQLLKRVEIAKEIGEYKRDNNVTILKLDRWEKIITQRMKDAEKIGLNPEFLKQILILIHKESIRIQNEIMN